jgi:hypothetical protein
MSFVDLLLIPSTTHFASPKRVARWRRYTGHGPALFVLTQIWIGLWVFAGVAVLVFGGISAINEVYLSYVLVETSCEITGSRERQHFGMQPSGGGRYGGGGLQRADYNTYEVRVSYLIGNEPHTAWVPISDGDLDTFRVKSKHRFFYKPNSPSVFRMKPPNAWSTMSFHLALSACLFTIAGIFWYAFYYDPDPESRSKRRKKQKE